MDEEPGPIVVDPHAFDSLWPALLVWFLLFVTAGDALTTVGRQAAQWWGAPATATVVAKHKGGTRRSLELSYDWQGAKRKTRENVGARGWARAAVGSRRDAHVLLGRAYLDDDFGYSRWKLGLFGAAWCALWLWAAARYRFG